MAPIYQRPKTSEPNPQHRIYPYLLRHLAIERPNQVWCADITYIPMRRGFLYLVAIMDWASRKVLAWRLSNTMDTDFCVAALEDAIARHGRPDIFNTDQGLAVHQLRLHDHAEGRRHPHLHGRPWPLDGQRLHRAAVAISLKYECVFLNAFETGSERTAASDRWIDYYNADRPHSAFGGRTPDEVYATQANEEKLAA